MKTTFLLSALVFLSFQMSLIAQSHVWNGSAGDHDWFNAVNWDAGTVPTISSEVLIPTGFSVEIEAAAATANAIILEGISTLTLRNNLSMAGSLTIAAGSNLNWLKGIISGSGTVDNSGLIQLESTEDKKLMNTTLNNYGAIYITNSNIIRLEQAAVINNFEPAAIDILSNGGLTQNEVGNTINNYGNIRKLDDGSGSGSFYMIYDMNNYGTIDVADGHQFLFLVTSANLNNTTTGILQGRGTYDITATFVNNGTFSPSGSDNVGTLDVVNNFTFSTNSILEIDIAGNTPGEFDVMQVVGFPDLEGTIDINLSYAPEIGDEYGVISANNIQSCNLADYVYATFEGFEYTFIVFCNSTNVTLRMVEINLAAPDFTSEKIEFYAYPNPSQGIVQFKFPAELIQNHSEAIITISNYLGQILEEIPIDSDLALLNTSKLAAGIYLAQLTSEKGRLASTRLVIQ